MRLPPTVGCLTAALACVAAAIAVPAEAEGRPTKAKLDLRLERTPIIVRNAYRGLPPMGRRGAMGANLEQSEFSLAHQQLGDLYVRAGIVYRKPKLIRRGFRAFDYAFARQRRDGSFPEDQPEGYAFFVEAVAHSALLLRKTRYGRRFDRKLRFYRDRLARAAPHMIEPIAWAGFKSRNPSYTHSGYSMGAALTLTGKLTGDGTFERYGRLAIREALDNQRPDGVNPELGGYDVRYQMAGILYAERFRVYFPGGRLAKRVTRMTDRGLGWMAGRVDRDGYINWRGSTRACRERSSTGRLKTPGYPFTVRGFAHSRALNRREALVEQAKRAHRSAKRVSGRKLSGPKGEPRGGGGGPADGLLLEILDRGEARDLSE